MTFLQIYAVVALCIIFIAIILFILFVIRVFKDFPLNNYKLNDGNDEGRFFVESHIRNMQKQSKLQDQQSQEKQGSVFDKISHYIVFFPPR